MASFSYALNWIKSGKKAARSGWNGKGMWVALQTPDAWSKMRQPYIYMRPVDGMFIPWLASQADLLAEDWEQVE